MTRMTFLRKKLHRAEQHLKAANAIGKTYCEGEFQTLAIERKSKKRLILRVVAIEPFPDEFSILIGETAHQLRSILEYIAFALSKPASQKPKPGKEKDVQFPFVTKKSLWREKSAHHLPGVGRRALAVFERFQPYHRGKQPGVKFLRQLHFINKWDKHRAPIASVVGIGLAEGAFSIPGVTITKIRFKPGQTMEVGTIVASLEVAKAPANLEVKVNTKMRLYPIFDKRMFKELAGESIFEILKGAFDLIDDALLPAFERFL